MRFGFISHWQPNCCLKRHPVVSNTSNWVKTKEVYISLPWVGRGASNEATCALQVNFPTRKTKRQSWKTKHYTTACFQVRGLSNLVFYSFAKFPSCSSHQFLCDWLALVLRMFLYLLFVAAIFAFFLSFWGQFRIFYFVCHAGPSEFSAFHNLTRCSPCCSLNPCLRFLGPTRYLWGPVLETLQKLWNAALFISA